MKRIIIIFLITPIFAFANQDSLLNVDKVSVDSITELSEHMELKQEKRNLIKQENIIAWRLQQLDKNTPMDLVYNDKVQVFIDSYLGRNKALISRMKGLTPYYFPMFERELDQYNLPLEFKYLAIVESALNPKARSRSGASGLWQFMYLTGKQYGLEVTSYMDERQDPLKATKSACEYFISLYDTFGDWNLVLAAYNGGPGYLQRKIASVGSSNFWELYPHLRKETRNYVPTFIAVNYAMQYANEHDITIKNSKINFNDIDTFILKKEVELKVLKELLCINEQTINYLNPAYKKSIFPKGAILTFPSNAVHDFKLNETANYAFIDAVENKEILINEERIVYKVDKGDYLGRIAKAHNVHVYEIKEWNKLKSTKLDIGDKLIIYVNKEKLLKTEKKISGNNEYIIQKGDTLWDIAQKYNGLSVGKIKALNNMENDNLKPGTTILLPTS
ncbi:MAG: LysM peptidoglycan-binding domain-containing protein [Flavobacteriales bacterium]|jgi:membrane-bound lytic murein transglycosylase D|nr:LysM peptidoglycan-binding domain-containing protein [Flavobacteriales bacterium]MBT5750575.1 LysM peptidoglycan-binding domain-containing protein [Flavobacteriales bacterium]